MIDGGRLLQDIMDAKGKEKGILKLEPRPRVIVEGKSALTAQGSGEKPPASPQPSVDRLSVTWADPGSMASTGVNLFHLPSETPVNSEVKFSPSAGDGSDDEDYSVSLSAVLRQRRASVRRSRKGRSRRPSSPFLPDEGRTRRRSSVFTTSSGDTAISIDEQPGIVTQEQIFENIHLHKEVLGSVKQQPLAMRRKLKIVHQAKAYIKRHEGQLQERLAQSKSTRDIYARFNILLATKWQQLKREAANTSNLLIPWELRIKEIESHFGSVVASYFTFLRWLFWVNLVIGTILLVFVIVPEYLTADLLQAGERKIILEDERRNATNLLTLWEFEGVLKCSAIFYGFYSNIENSEYRMPLAYFLTGLSVYIYSFVAILRKMAENSRMSKLSEKEDECIFSWKLFTGWDFMIGNAETAHNRIASVILGFKEALLEEAEKKKNLSWRILSLRALVNICVVILLAISAYAVVTVVSRSDNNTKPLNWWRENETTIVVTVISITFPLFFELLGYLEHFHPRKQLRLQLARIMLLNLLNLYSLIFALFSKIEGMSEELYALQPNITMNAVIMPNNTVNTSENFSTSVPLTCFQTTVPCLPTNMANSPVDVPSIASTKVLMTYAHDSGDITNAQKVSKEDMKNIKKNYNNRKERNVLVTENLPDGDYGDTVSSTSLYSIVSKEIEKLRNISKIKILKPLSSSDDFTATNESIDGGDDPYYYDNENITFDAYDDNENNFLSSTAEDYFTISLDTSTVQSNSETKYNPNGSQNTIEDVSTKDAVTYQSMSTDSLTQTNTEAYSDNSFMENPKTSTLQYSTTSKLTNEENNKLASIDIDFVPTDYYDITTSSNEYTSIADTIVTTLRPEYNDNYSTLKYIKTSQIPILNNHNNNNNCPNLNYNCSINCGQHNITQTFHMVNCTIIGVKFYISRLTDIELESNNLRRNSTNCNMIDTAYMDNNKRKMYNLTIATKKKLLKLCWETMFGQELVKLTMMDLVFVVLGTLFLDFFRALFVKYMNRCWCWDLEKRFPEYGDFKIAENILHLINNQGMVWMGMFFSPGLVVLNIFKLMIMMYLRSWAVMTCNVPHEVVFRVSKSNNFYLALLLTMLFLCVLPVGYSIVWVTPSWHCGPFSGYNKIYNILTTNIYKILPKSLNFTLEYIASPAIVIPLLLLLILIIYYLISLTSSLREANNDLKIQLRRERTEERRKMFQLADTRRRVGSSAMESTPFARWKKALPSLPISKSIDSDDRKTTTAEDIKEPIKSAKRKGGFFAKIVGLAIDKNTSPKEPGDSNASPNNLEDETDTDFHESLPKEVLKSKDITLCRKLVQKNKSNVSGLDLESSKPADKLKVEDREKDSNSKIANEKKEKKTVLENVKIDHNKDIPKLKSKSIKVDSSEENDKIKRKINQKQSSETSNQSKQSDSIGSVIPVITISTTESDDEMLQASKPKQNRSVKEQTDPIDTTIDATISLTKKANRSSTDFKSLHRQRSVDSINESKSKDKKSEDGHKPQ